MRDHQALLMDEQQGMEQLFKRVLPFLEFNRAGPGRWYPGIAVSWRVFRDQFPGVSRRVLVRVLDYYTDHQEELLLLVPSLEATR